MPPHPSAPSWSEAATTLLELADDDLALGADPAPRLLAFEGGTGVAVVGLRPFGDDDGVQALVEVLALLLPLGADRVALALPGRAWSMDDPIPPVTDGVDLRTRVLLVTTVDGCQRPAALTVALHPFESRGPDRRWGPSVCPDDPGVSPIGHALRVLVDGRGALTEGEDDLRLAARFGHVLLRGHEVALAPPAARRLEAAAGT
jgi:hypothetical protein